MNKEKLTKLVRLVLGVLLIVVITLFFIDGDWENAFSFLLVFIILWIIPAIFKEK